MNPFDFLLIIIAMVFGFTLLKNRLAAKGEWHMDKHKLLLMGEVDSGARIQQAVDKGALHDAAVGQAVQRVAGELLEPHMLRGPDPEGQAEASEARETGKKIIALHGVSTVPA